MIFQLNQISKSSRLQTKNPSGGFIALISILLVSMVLLVTVTTLNLTGYIARESILDAEFKEMSISLAEACGNIAVIKLASDFTYTQTSESVEMVNGNQCKIISVTGSSTIKTARVQANSHELYTNLEIEVTNSPSFKINSWKECADFIATPCVI